MTTWVALAFAAASADQSPNIRTNDNGRAFEMYRRAIQVAVSSVRRFQTAANIVLVTDEPKAFAGLQASLLVRPFLHRPPQPLHDTFTASLYLLDAMAAMGEVMDDQDTVVFIDPDCLVVGSLDQVVTTAQAHGAAGLPIDYAPGHVINGLRRSEAQTLGRELDGVDVLPVHYGGEAYAFTRAGLQQAVALSERAYAQAAASAVAGQRPRFTTEEHMLSYALNRMGCVGDLSPYTQRIWTSRRYRNVSGREQDLLIWHLPAEKARGFRRLYRPSTDPGSWFWTMAPDNFRRRAARVMGVERGPLRASVDAGARALHAARQLVVRASGDQ
jgi:hypothetical protein